MNPILFSACRSGVASAALAVSILLIAIPGQANDADGRPVAEVRAGGEAVSAIDQLRAFVTNTASASGRFEQTGASLGADEASRGEFAFARPGRFRWEVIEPYPQLLVADGKDVYFHDVDLNQVTVRPMSGALGATPAAILFGTGNIDDRFEMTDDGEQDGLHWLMAVPREKEAGFERIRIGFANSLPAAMEVLDAFNNTSRFRFSEVTPNPALDEQVFRFEIPPGTDVVRP